MFKYHMTPQRGREVCSNRQSAVIWKRGDFAKSSYNFYSGWTKLNLQFLLLYFWYMWGEGIGWKRNMGRRDW